MPFGPIVTRELITLARRRDGYGGRTVVPFLLLMIVGVNFYGWRYWNGGPNSVEEMALFGRMTFAQFAFAQVVATAFLVPDLIARSIAEERDRKTLTFLLTTRLSSGEIVLGKLAAGLWQYAGCLFAGLPVMLLLPLFGGVEPELVLLAYAGTASTALFLGETSLAISVAARRVREARRITVVLVSAWLLGPIVVAAAIPSLAPRFYPWVRPLNELALASSPTGVLLSLVGFLPRGRFLDVLGRMIALQLAGATLSVLGAIAWLRLACRHHEGGESRLLSRRGERWRFGARPPCGDRPMLWKERYVGGARGLPRFLAVLASLLVLVAVGALTYYTGRGAVDEVLAGGYASAATTAVTLTTSRRTFFNQYLRFMTVLGSFLYSLTLTGLAAEGIGVERAQETWLGLIATPMDGREIVRAKMFGALWRARGFVLLMVALWTCGLLAGALHPLGFASALIGLGVSTWFYTALGTYCSLRARELRTASSASLLPVLLLDLSGYLPRALPEAFQTILLGTGSFPLAESLAMVSYAEVSQGLAANPSPTLDALGIAGGEGAWCVLLTCALWAGGTALAAFFLDRLAVRQFDRLIGRPYLSDSK